MKNNEIRLQKSEIFEINRLKTYKPIHKLLDSLMPTVDPEDTNSECVNLPITLGLMARQSIFSYRYNKKNNGFKFVTRVKRNRLYVWKVDESVTQHDAVENHRHYQPRKDFPDYVLVDGGVSEFTARSISSTTTTGRPYYEGATKFTVIPFKPYTET